MTMSPDVLNLMKCRLDLLLPKLLRAGEYCGQDGLWSHGARQTWVGILALPIANYVTLGKLLSLAENFASSYTT